MKRNKSLRAIVLAFMALVGFAMPMSAQLVYPSRSGAGAVTSVNTRTGAVTGLAEAGANADITSMTGLSNGGIPLAKVSGAAGSGANSNITSMTGLSDGGIPLLKVNGALGNSLTSAYVIVGNGSNLAVGVALTGDVTITNAGVTTIKSNVALVGNPTTTTQSAHDNSTKIATTAYVDAAAGGGAASQLTSTTSNTITLSSNLAGLTITSDPGGSGSGGNQLIIKRGSDNATVFTAGESPAGYVGTKGIYSPEARFDRTDTTYGFFYTMAVGNGETNGGNYVFTDPVYGYLQFKGGSNGHVGSGTLVSGTATISNTSVTANSHFVITGRGGGTSALNGALRVSATTPGTGFVVTSNNGGDDNNFDYLIYESN